MKNLAGGLKLPYSSGNTVARSVFTGPPRALWGSRGRRFKSCRPDFLKHLKTRQKRSFWLRPERAFFVARAERCHTGVTPEGGSLALTVARREGRCVAFERAAAGQTLRRFRPRRRLLLAPRSPWSRRCVRPFACMESLSWRSRVALACPPARAAE